MTIIKYRTGVSILLVLLCLYIAPVASAQSYIDEDFLDNLYANAAGMLKESNPSFNTEAVPAKWDKESAVIIGYSRSVLFDRKSSGGFFSRRERSLYFSKNTFQDPPE